MGNEVTKKEQNEVMDNRMFEGHSTGFEGTTNETFKTPFLKMLQALSPELDEADAKHIQGAKQGLFCNSATQELFSEIDVVVLKVEHSLITWKPNRGGFVGRVNKSKEDTVVHTSEGVKKWDVEGNDVMDTVEFFCMNIKDPSDIFVLSLSGASFKHAKSFATRLRMLKVDGKPVNVSWAGIWKLTTIKESNEQGSWYTISAPLFIRTITKSEMENFVLPAKEMIESAVTDYSVIESTTVSEEETPY